MGDFGSFAKHAVRLIAGIIGGSLLGYEYYSFSANPDEALWPAIGMGFVSMIMIYFLLHSIGKGSE